MAGDKDLEKEIRKVEKNSLQKFKNQNIILKKFKKDGLKVYRAVRKSGISIGELLEKTKMEKKAVLEILEFLRKKGMVEDAGEAAQAQAPKKKPSPAKEEKKVAPKKKEAPKAKGKKEEPKPRKEEPEAPEPEGEKLPKASAKEKKEPTPATIAPGEEIAPDEDEILPVEDDSEISPEMEFGVGAGEEGKKEPEEDEAPEPKEPAAKDEGAPAEGPSKKEEEPEEAPAEEDELMPLDFGEEEAPAGEAPPEEKPRKKEEEPKEPEPEEEELETSGREIAPDSGEGQEDEGEDEEDEEDIFLTPGEKKIKAKYGEKGIKVYNLIDGQRTAEEIMRSTGVTEKTLIEMLDFMEKEGIIKLEHPGTKKPKSGGAPPASVSEAAAKGDIGFAPMLEEQSTPEKPLGGEEGKAFTLSVPKKIGGGMLKEIQAKTNLMLKYKQPGVKVLEMINGSRDSVELSIKSGLPLYTVCEILSVLERDGVVKLEPAARTEIQKKYGEDGYSVYKKYGREGVMLYQLIGKDMDLREMARQTSKDVDKVVKIFMFIHKLLGIELPIDEDVLLERLKEGGA